MTTNGGPALCEKREARPQTSALSLDHLRGDDECQIDNTRTVLGRVGQVGPPKIAR